MTKPKQVISVLAAVIAVALLLSACGDGTAGNGDSSAETTRLTPIAATEIQPRDLSRQLALSGVVEPRAAIRLASRTSGTIHRVLVEEGDRVEAGDLVVELDTSEQRAELARADAEMEQARLEYERSSELRQRNMLSRAEYERARAELAVAESQRALWRTRVDFGQVRAPRTAMVTARYVEPGEAVNAQDVLLELAVMDELVIRLGVSELDVIHLVPGQEVPVRLDAMPARQFASEIRRIFPAADRDSRLVTVEVALPSETARQGVRAGYLGRVNLTIDQRDGVLAVPSAAIGEDGDKRYIYVVADDRLHYRQVTPGVSRGQWTEITEGIEAGDIVLATNPIDMRDEQAVRIVGWRG